MKKKINERSLNKFLTNVKIKSLNSLKLKVAHLLRFTAIHIKRNYQYTSDSSEYNHHKRKRKFKPYEEISGEFKKIKPPTFNGETEKGEEAESWLSGMKKYFKI